MAAMVEQQIVTALKTKRDAIEATILAHEKRAAQARLDLAHINATITQFELTADSADTAPNSNFRPLFKRGEAPAYARWRSRRKAPWTRASLPTRDPSSEHGRSRPGAAAGDRLHGRANPCHAHEAGQDRQ